MSKVHLKRLLTLTYPPQVSKAMIEGLLGKVPKVITLTTEETLSLNFEESSSIQINLGAKDVTSLTGSLVGLLVGETVGIKFVQPAVARTLVFDTNVFNVANAVVITNKNNGSDLWIGIFNGTKIDIAPFVTY